MKGCFSPIVTQNYSPLSTFFIIFQFKNTTAYHLGLCKPSSPSSKEIQGLAEQSKYLHEIKLVQTRTIDGNIFKHCSAKCITLKILNRYRRIRRLEWGNCKMQVEDIVNQTAFLSSFKLPYFGTMSPCSISTNPFKLFKCCWPAAAANATRKRLGKYSYVRRYYILVA